MCFLVTFCTTQKVTIRSLCREHRGSVNLESAHPNNTFPLTKLKPFQKGDSRFCKPRISAQNYNFAQAQLNPLPLRGFFRRLCRLFCCLRQPVAALGGYFFRLTAMFLPGRHTPCACFAALGGYISVADATFAACGGISRRQSRLYNLPFRQVKNGTFRITKSPVIYAPNGQIQA